jgi:hypothetical protein
MALLKRTFGKQPEQQNQEEEEWVDPVERGRGGLETARVPVKFDLDTLDLIDDERGKLSRSQFIRRAVDYELGKL